MKRILVIIAVLSLIAGTAYAAALNDGLTRQVWEQTKGRSVVSDETVAMRVWYTGSGNGQISVSTNTIKAIQLYDNGVNTQAAFSTYGTVQKMVDYIDSLATWSAAVGPDMRGGDLLEEYHFLNAITATTAGTSKQSPTYITDDASRRRLSVGVEATEGKWNRLKRVGSKYAITAPGTVSMLVYDGDTLVYREDVDTTAYNTATSPHASPNTIIFTDCTDKGISAGQGKSLVVVVSANTALVAGTPIAADTTSDHNISIVYDQF